MFYYLAVGETDVLNCELLHDVYTEKRNNWTERTASTDDTLFRTRICHYWRKSHWIWHQSLSIFDSPSVYSRRRMPSALHLITADSILSSTSRYTLCLCLYVAQARRRLTSVSNRQISGVRHIQHAAVAVDTEVVIIAHLWYRICFSRRK